MARPAYLWRCAVVLVWRATVASFVAACVGASVDLAIRVTPMSGFLAILQAWVSMLIGLGAAFVIGTYPGIWGKWPERP